MTSRLERIVVFSLKNLFVKLVDQRQGTRRGGKEIADQFPIKLMMIGEMNAVYVHQLNGEIDPLGGRVSLLGAQNVFLT